jgi:hypothetical protein
MQLPVRTFFLPSVIALGLVVALPQRSFATSTLILESQSGGVYDYEFALDNGDAINFSGGQDVTLTGLSGVAGVSMQSNFASCFSSASTGSSVTLTATGGSANCDFINGEIDGIEDVGTLVVDSSVDTAGLVDFDVQGKDSIANAALGDGTVDGPVAAVAATPEPSSWLLLGSGMLGLIGAARRKRI